MLQGRPIYFCVALFSPIHTIGMITVTESFNCETIVWDPPADTGGEITGYAVRVYYKVNGQRTNGSTMSYSSKDPDRQWIVTANLPQQRHLYYQVSFEKHWQFSYLYKCKRKDNTSTVSSYKVTVYCCLVVLRSWLKTQQEYPSNGVPSKH